VDQLGVTDDRKLRGVLSDWLAPEVLIHAARPVLGIISAVK
jgi:hypothetical protein